VLKYALHNIKFSLRRWGKGVRGMTDRFPAVGFDEGRIFMNSRNEAEVTITGISGILKKSSKMPTGF